MLNRASSRHHLLAFVLTCSALAGIGATITADPARAELPESVAYCMECHGIEGNTMTLQDGTEMDLYLRPEDFADSVHAEQLVCTDCHEKYEEDHPSGATFPSQRAYEITSYEICKRCHFDTYTRTLESVHYEFLKEGFDVVPVCTDCHGTHDIHDPHEKRAMMSRSCGQCHVDVAEEYGQSVHGKALAEEGVADVPGCADCHTAHTIADPRTVKFHLASPEICVRCHGDAAMMEKYGIPTDVATTYLSDFHGVTASLSQVTESEDRQLVVTCVDCHGVHSIQSPRLIGSKEMKDQVAKVCASCHEGAATDFPAAWLSHFQPSLRHAPLVFLVDLLYRIFIPFVILGLILQVLLHLYRVAIRR